jgi:hypothetical protein
MRARNRSAIVVRPNPPFLDWLNAVDPTSQALTLDSLTREPTIYLVEECDDPDDERACLQAVDATIFEDQLNGWWRDRATGPTPRSLAIFRSWFDCQFHSMLLDLADAPPIEEEI